MPRYFKQDTSFQTDRLNINGVTFSNNESIDRLKSDVLKIMTPKVTKALPLGWQHIDSMEQAEIWLKEQVSESAFFVIQSKVNNRNIGFLFLYEPSCFSVPVDIRVGYLLSQDYWGNGLASELISGLIIWCKSLGKISSISGGVEVENKGSIRVLEKNGFIKSKQMNDGGLLYVYTFSNENSET